MIIFFEDGSPQTSLQTMKSSILYQHYLLTVIKLSR